MPVNHRGIKWVVRLREERDCGTAALSWRKGDQPRQKRQCVFLFVFQLNTKDAEVQVCICPELHISLSSLIKHVYYTVN